jgi:protein TonB
MFDLITGKVQHVPSTPAIPILVSTGIQGTALAVIVLTSLLFATRELPPVPDMMAFMGMPAAVAPPPPPPPAPVAQAQAAPKPPVANAFAAPVEAPREIAPEPLGVAATGGDIGVPGGVEGGIVGGVVGSTAAIVEGPPPPPPPPVQHGPVQVGGQIQAPALVKRVEPIYPAIAQFAAIDGIVILDAVVDEHGRVQSVKVLRGHPLLAKAATDAVQQWMYEPLRLNGTATPFELTVSLWFHFDDKPKRHS